MGRPMNTGAGRVRVDRETAMRVDRYVMRVGTRRAMIDLRVGDLVLQSACTEGCMRADTLARLVARLDEVVGQ